MLKFLCDLPDMAMLKKRFIKLVCFLIVFGLVIFVPITVLAQETDTVIIEDSSDTQVVLEPIITASDSVEINKNIIFDASKSTNPNPEVELSYTWDFGDGNKKEGVEVVHSYSALGPKTVSLTINNGAQELTTTKEIFVYTKIILFITDKTDLQDRVDGFNNYARDRDVNLEIFESYESATEFISEEVLERELSESLDKLRKIDQIVVMTDGNVGLDALSRVKQQQADTKEPLSFEQKSILVLTDGSQSFSSVQRQFDLIKAQNIIIAKEAAIYPFIDSKDSETFLQRLQADGYEYSLLNVETAQLQLWNFVSYFVNFLIDSGIPANTLILILLLPVIATIVAFMKQVVGLTTFGVYTPSIITLTFWILGLKVGILTILIIFLAGTLTRHLLKRFRLLYIPKMAIVLTVVALAILAMLIILLAFNLFDAQFFSLAIFPMLILGTLTEKFVNIQSSKGFKKAIILTLETVLVSVIAYIAIGGEVDILLLKFKFTYIQTLMLSYPEIIILFIIINIFFGRWTGLRLLEYVRFREVLRHVEEE